MNKLPMYVTLNGTALRLDKRNKVYYRHAGQWDVGYKWKDGKLLSTCEFLELSWLDGVELIPITKERWEKDNEGYI